MRAHIYTKIDRKATNSKMPKKDIDKQPIRLKSLKSFEELENFCNIIKAYVINQINIEAVLTRF
jgi:hypothetical protein